MRTTMDDGQLLRGDWMVTVMFPPPEDSEPHSSEQPSQRACAHSVDLSETSDVPFVFLLSLCLSVSVLLDPFFFLSYSFSPLSVVFISLLFANEINTCLTPHFSYRGSWKNRPRLNNGVNDILMHISKDESVDVLRCG